MLKSLSEIIAEVEKQKKPKAQADILMKNSSSALKTIIGYAMDPNVKWLLPETDPPYKPNGLVDQEGLLYNECRKFIYFVDSEDGRSIKTVKKETLFIQLLETIDAKDAIMVLRVKNKALKISKTAVKIAFPNISKSW